MAEETDSKSPVQDESLARQPAKTAPANPSQKKGGHVYKSRREKWIDFALGFVGWYVSSSVLWLMTSPVSPLQLLALLCLPLHIVVLIVLGIKRRWMALGVLATFAVNLAIATFMGMLFPAWCGAPFTVWPQYH